MSQDSFAFRSPLDASERKTPYPVPPASSKLRTLGAEPKNSEAARPFSAPRRGIFGRLAAGLIAGLLCAETFAAEAPSVGPPEAPAGLLVDLLPEPLAVEDLETPRLSWVVRDARRGAVQTAYQVLVATDPEALAPGETDVWNSGRVDGAASVAVPYDGPPLEPATRYYWTVRTWNGADEPGPFAEPAAFGTALRDEWDAVPIWAETDSSAGEDDYPRSGDNWALLRTDFEVSGRPISHATLYATGVDPEPAAQHVYRAELNGGFVGVGPTRGYDGMTMYNAFDVTGLLETGTNTLAFVAYAASGQAVQAQLDIVYADGDRQRIGTGTNWRARSGSDLYLDVGNAGHGSYYYAPREYLRADRWPHGFSEPGFDASDWSAPIPQPEIEGLTGLGTRNLKREIREPVHVEKIGDGAYRFDFGRTVVGGLRLTVDGTRGSEVDIRLGEERNDDGSVRFRMRTGNHYRDRWTLAGGEQTLEHFGYRVFRYAEVHGLPASANPGDIAGIGLVYPFDEDAAHFSSSDEHLNEVWRFSRDSIRLLNMELYMDTPSRERRAYEADAYLQQLSHYALDREFALARHSTEYLFFNYTWPTEWKLTSPTAAWRDYLHTGDDRSLARHYELLRDTKSVRHFMDDRNLVDKSPGGAHDPDAWTDIIDWPAQLRDGYVFTDVNTVINTYNERSLRDLGRIAAVLGRDREAKELTALADASAAAINEHLFDPGAGVYRDGFDVDHHALHASIFPLAFGVATEREAGAARALAERGIVGNIFSGAYQVEALFEYGRAGDAVDLLGSDDLKSWRNMIATGAGTTMETWDPSLKGNTTFSHPAGASPAYLIPRGLFGIDAMEPAHRRFSVEPRPGGVERASLRLPTMSGSIEAAYEVDGDALVFDLTVPANTTAELRLPAEEIGLIRERGSPLTGVEGIEVTEVANGTVTLEVSAGSYSFVAGPDGRDRE